MCNSGNTQPSCCPLTLNSGIDQTITFDDSQILQLFLSNSNRHRSKLHIIVDDLTVSDLEHLDLTYAASQSLTVPNAGGRSVKSEMLSIQYFSTIHGATNIILEMQIQYWSCYSMVDFICTINNNRVGVSVTRAMHYQDPNKFTLEDATRLLNKKLNGLIVASNAVCKSQRFFKSVLHVWCQSTRIAQLVSAAYEAMDDVIDLKRDMLLHLSVYDNVAIYQGDKL